MKIDNRKKIRSVAGENVLIQQVDGAADMTRVVGLNESAMKLYNALKDSEFTIDDVVRQLTDTYDVDATTARRDAEAWLKQMREQGLLTD
ncbi:MAG: PqqD family protein [Bacteroidales bacterium]|nr:PqqD family protein [Bacteroidales bacterium]